MYYNKSSLPADPLVIRNNLYCSVCLLINLSFVQATSVALLAGLRRLTLEPLGQMCLGCAAHLSPWGCHGDNQGNRPAFCAGEQLVQYHYYCCFCLLICVIEIIYSFARPSSAMRAADLYRV